MKELDGRVAIVTGAGSPRGMGRAIVEELAKQGAAIVASDVAQGPRDPLQEMMGYQYGADQGLDETVAAAEKLGVEALAVRADVTDAAAVEALVAAAAERFERVDILVNVAGGSWGTNRVADYDPEQWMHTVRVNLFGTFLTTKHALPHMVAQGRGAIVNISSVAAIRGHEMVSAYGAAKAGMVAFTRDVAVEYGPEGIRANAVLPGDIQTDLLTMEYKGMSMVLGITEDEVVAKSIEATPVRRTGEPADVAQVVAFLCSDRAAFLTGLAIPITGGKELAWPQR